MCAVFPCSFSLVIIYSPIIRYILSWLDIVGSLSILIAFYYHHYYKSLEHDWNQGNSSWLLEFDNDLAHSDTTAGTMYQNVLTSFWVSFILGQKYRLFYTGAVMTSILNKQGNTALACLISPISS